MGRICQKCSREGEFYPHRAKCKNCVKARVKERYKIKRNDVLIYQRQYYDKHKEAVLEYHRDYNVKNRQLIRNRNLRRLYGITDEGFEALLNRQERRCALCCTDNPKGPKKQWHMDHDHNMGGLRGILCPRCNLGLGYFSDDPELLRKAAGYIEMWKERLLK